MPLNRTSLAEIIDRIHTIPSLPEVVTQVTAMVNNPKADAKKIQALVIKDPAMASKMLRMVNSPLYGLAAPMNDLEQAIAVLGFKAIRSIALSVSVINAFQQQNTCFAMKPFWAHSAVSASLCRLIGDMAELCDPELAFIIGLLKDIGKLVLVENAPQETRAIIAVAKEHKLSFNRAAHQVLDTDDAEIGAWLCEHWKFDKDIVRTVLHQYEQELAPDRKLVAMCQLSEYICATKNIRSSGCYDKPELRPEMLQLMGLDAASFKMILTVADSEIEKARQLLVQLTG